jgi:hypothetical protein
LRSQGGLEKTIVIFRSSQLDEESWVGPRISLDGRPVIDGNTFPN